MKNDKKTRKFTLKRRGQTLVEYVLLVALIAVILIAAVTILGGNVNNKYCAIDNSISR